MTETTKKVNEDIANLLRARNTLLWVVTREEKRAESAIIAAAASAQYETRLWDCATSLTNASGATVSEGMQDPERMLSYIRETQTRMVYILRDLTPWLRSPSTNRMLRSLARQLQSEPREKARAIIVLTPDSQVPPELTGHATVIDYPLPDRAEMGSILDSVLERLPANVAKSALASGQREAAIDAVIGLTADEAASCYAKSLVTTKVIDAALVSNEKKRVIAREKVLSWYDPNPAGFDGLGGLDLLKSWAKLRKGAFSPEARTYGLKPPKGALVAGISGCGKSEFAKCIASAWGQPLLRLDLGALKSKWVGESEANIRRALNLAVTVAPCVLWIDEIEKALAGSTGQQGDGGISSDALGAILTWMQEREAPVFVVATANDVSGLPPELSRKGRFDEIFWVDLPTHSERMSILSVALKRNNRPVDQIDLDAVADRTKEFTGAEITALVPEAMFEAFADGQRQIETRDLLNVATHIVPLARSSAEKVEALKKWAKERARPASSPEIARVVVDAGALDLNVDPKAAN